MHRINKHFSNIKKKIIIKISVSFLKQNHFGVFYALGTGDVRSVLAASDTETELRKLRRHNEHRLEANDTNEYEEGRRKVWEYKWAGLGVA